MSHMIDRAAAIDVAKRHRSKLQLNEPLWHEGQDWASDRIAEAIAALPPSPDADAVQLLVQMAVEQERERCAKIALNMNNGETTKAIAAAIRAGGKP